MALIRAETTDTAQDANPRRTTRTPRAAECRLCGQALRHGFVDLGMSPPCESYVTAEQLNQMEAFYPLRVYVCERLSARAARGLRSTGRDLQRVCVFLLVFGHVAEACVGVCGHDRRAPGLECAAPA